MAAEKYTQKILIVGISVPIGTEVGTQEILTSHFGKEPKKIDNSKTYQENATIIVDGIRLPILEIGTKTIKGIDREGECMIVQKIETMMNGAPQFNILKRLDDAGVAYDGIIIVADLMDHNHLNKYRELIDCYASGRADYFGGTHCIIVGIEEDVDGCREQVKGAVEEVRNIANNYGIPYLGCSLRSLNKEVAGAMFTTIAEQIIVRGENVTRDPAAQKKMLKETLPQEIKEYKSEISKSDYSKVMDGKSAKTDGGTKIKPKKLSSNTDIIGEGFLKKLQRESDQETTVDEANKFIRNHPNLGPKTQARIRVEQGRQSGDVCYYAHAVTTLSNAKISNSDPLMMEANGRMGMERGAPGQAIKSASR